MTEVESPEHDASVVSVYPPSHCVPKKPSGQAHWEHCASSTPPFWHLSAHVEHVGPVRPLSQRHVQSLSVTAPLAHWAVGQAVGVCGFTTVSPPIDSMVHSSVPRRMRKKPPSPHLGPHEFWQSQ